MIRDGLPLTRGVYPRRAYLFRDEVPDPVPHEMVPPPVRKAEDED